MEDFKEGDRVILDVCLEDLGGVYIDAYEYKQILTIIETQGDKFLACENEYGDRLEVYVSEVSKAESKIQSKIKTKYKI